MRKRSLIGLGLLILLALVAVSGVAAQDKTLYWERYDVTITVNPDGTFWVEESQAINFTSGTFRYGYRSIPLNRVDKITDVQVFENGVAFESSSSELAGTFKTYEEDGNFYVYWYFQPTNGPHTYVLRYLVHGGLRYYDGGDQIWWKAVYAGRAAEVRASKVVVQLPSGATAQKAAAYNVQANVAGEGSNTVVFTALEKIPSDVEYEVRVQFPHGLVAGRAPSWQRLEDLKPTINLVVGVLSVLLFVGGIGGLLLLWYLRGRDPNVAIPAELLQSPPTNDRPGVIGALLDERADMQDIIATLVDLARRGYVIFKEEQTAGLFGTTNRDFVFQRTSKATQDLEPYEQRLIQAVFGSRRDRSLKDLREKFYTEIPKLQSDLYAALVKRGYFHASPQQVRTQYTLLGILLLVVGVGLGFFLMVLLSGITAVGLCPGIALAGIGITTIIVAQSMPHKTQQGAEAAARWKAFRRYLESLERYTDLRQATELFDQYLPYAIAFGLERSWINKFSRLPSDVIVPMPTWYHPVYYGSGGGHRGLAAPAASGGMPSLQQASDGMAGGLQSISDGLISMLNSTASTFVSAPSSDGIISQW